MTSTIKTLYGLRFNPFSQDVPDEALLTTPQIEHFAWRLEHGLASEGGFAMITGEHGCGKSTTLRLVFARLERQRDVSIAFLQRPQSSIADFYREMGELFGVTLKPSNRWGGFRSLRDKWISHIEGSLLRPILLVDEAQEMHHQVLAELRLLTQTRFDSRCILGIVFAGDRRLPELLQRPELAALGSRIRTRLSLEPASPDDLRACLEHRMKVAGNTKLMTSELLDALCEHSLGNYRHIMQVADELLAQAARTELDVLDEKLYFEIFSPQPAKPQKAKPTRKRAAPAVAGRRR